MRADSVAHPQQMVYSREPLMWCRNWWLRVPRAEEGKEFYHRTNEVGQNMQKGPESLCLLLLMDWNFLIQPSRPGGAQRRGVHGDEVGPRV